MSQLYYGLVTDVGLAKLAASAAGGPSLTLSTMAFGDGGGVETAPTKAAMELVNERYRAPVVEKYPHPTNASILYVEGVIPPGVGGWTLREAGIYDADGDLIVIAKPPTMNVALISEGASTEGVVRLPIVFDSLASVELLIDPTVLLATQGWVLERVLTRPFITVDSVTTVAPPGAPAAHSLYLVPESATGVWAGQTHKLAYYLGGWRYYVAPRAKIIAASDSGKSYRRTADGWEELWVEAEVKKAIENAGITAEPGSGTRLAEALSRTASGGVFYTDNGATNAVRLQQIGSFKQPQAYFDGQEVNFYPAAANTSAANIRVGTVLPVVPLVEHDGTPLTVDRLGTKLISARYHAGSASFRIQPWALAANPPYMLGDVLSGYSIPYNTATKLQYTIVRNTMGGTWANNVFTAPRRGTYLFLYRASLSAPNGTVITAFASAIDATGAPTSPYGALAGLWTYTGYGNAQYSQGLSFSGSATIELAAGESVFVTGQFSDSIGSGSRTISNGKIAIIQL
ncbi:MAG TPA: phage tail protein [Ancylobacter sp.]